MAPAPKTGMWHFHLDHLGTPRMVTNQNSGSIGFHRYYPFGQEQTALQEGEVMKFTGHERDLANLAGTADDLDYMHARHYSPLTARFLSTDRLAARPSSPQSWNRYAYVEGSPLSYYDPDGLGKVGFVAKVVQFVGIGGRRVVGKVFSRDAAKAAQQSGENIRMANRKSAEELAKEIGGGRPPIHETGKGRGQSPHYHPADRSGGHIFYSLAAGLTLSHYVQGWGETAQALAMVVDILSPLSLGQDVVDLYEIFIPGEDSGTLIQGIQVTAPAESSPFANYYTVSQAPFLYQLSAYGHNMGNFVSIYDLFLSGSVCIEGVCSGPP